MIWRIERRDTFLALRSGRRGRSGPLVASWVPGDPDVPPRVAFAIGRKVGNAVTRNRLRRQLRSLLRESPALAPGAWLLAASPGLAGLGYGELATTVDAAVRGAQAAPRRAPATRPGTRR